MAGVDDIIGGWIKQAERSGEIKRNPYYGKRLQLTDGYLDTPEELRMAFKILQDGGFLPPQVEMLNELADLKEALAKTTEEAEQKRLRIEIANKQQQVAVLLGKYRKS